MPSSCRRERFLMARLRPESWPTIDDVRETTARVWCSPLHERIDRLLVVDVLATTVILDGGPSRQPAWTPPELDRVVAHLRAAHGATVIGRVALRRAARAVRSGVGSLRILRERLVRSGRIEPVVARGRSATYRLPRRLVGGMHDA